MKAELVKRRPSPYVAAEGVVYAYEAALDWLSLDPQSPYRGWEGTKRVARELWDDFNSDGNIDLIKLESPGNGEQRVSFEPAGPRVEVTQDSVIVTTKVPVPGGSIVHRHAEARRRRPR